MAACHCGTGAHCRAQPSPPPPFACSPRRWSCGTKRTSGAPAAAPPRRSLTHRSAPPVPPEPCWKVGGIAGLCSCKLVEMHPGLGRSLPRSCPACCLLLPNQATAHHRAWPACPCHAPCTPSNPCNRRCTAPHRCFRCRLGPRPCKLRTGRRHAPQRVHVLPAGECYCRLRCRYMLAARAPQCGCLPAADLPLCTCHTCHGLNSRPLMPAPLQAVADGDYADKFGHYK